WYHILKNSSLFQTTSYNFVAQIINKIAESNGKKVPNGVVLALDEEINKSANYSTQDLEESKKNDQKEATGSIIDVVRWSVTRTRLIVTVSISFLVSMVYYGLNLNVVNLDTNLYLSVVLNAASEMPAFAITALLVDRLGRKPLAVGTMCFSGVFCLVGSVVGNEGAWAVVRMICGVLGIFGMAATYNLMFIYIAELFPTVVRNTVLGSNTQSSQLAALLSPFIVVLGGCIPLAIFAACGVAGALMTVFFLPDTLNQPMYDTIGGMTEAQLHG
ncbi:Organic cation/carnitine transporter 4, partial [Linum grandiflorum]